MGKFEEDLKNRVWATSAFDPEETDEALLDEEEAQSEPEEAEEAEEAEEEFEEEAETGPAVLRRSERMIAKLNKARKKRRRRRKRNPFILLLFAVIIIVLSVLILNSDIFAIKKIEVEGNRYYTPAQVIEMSEIESGKNLIFELKARAARNKLLETPYIKSVHLEPVLPHTVRIKIEERIEYAAVAAGGKYVVIDKDGLVLRISDTEPEVTIMEGIELSESGPGKPIKAAQTYLLSETLRLLSATEEQDLYFKKVFFSAAVVRTYLDDDYYCEGTPESILKNLPAIKELAEQHYAQGIRKGIIKVGADGYLSFNPRID